VPKMTRTEPIKLPRRARPASRPVNRCATMSVCGYLRQRALSSDLWLMPDDLLFWSRPLALTGRTEASKAGCRVGQGTRAVLTAKCRRC
jgi:hypothetical protein